MVNIDHSDIISYYNSIIYGILNFYSFVDNKTRLGAIIKYQFKHSCALILALKYKPIKRAKAFKRSGRDLKCSKTQCGIAIPSSFKRDAKFLTKTPMSEEMVAKKMEP